MKYLLIILIPLAFACSKTDRYKVVADGEKYSLTIEIDNEIITYTNLEGKFTEKGRGDIIGLYVTPITGTVTAEVLINGSVCNGVYDMGYDSNNVTEYFQCD